VHTNKINILLLIPAPVINTNGYFTSIGQSFAVIVGLGTALLGSGALLLDFSVKAWVQPWFVFDLCFLIYIYIYIVGVATT